MSFRRKVAPDALATGPGLTAAMIGIGMRFAGEPAPDPNIEDTLVAASVAGLEEGDLRTLSVLTTWLGVHAARVNADRLVRLARLQSPRVRAYWAATGRWLSKDRRLARLAKLYRGPRQDILPTGSDYLLRRKGEDPRFDGTPIRVPAGTLRDRPSDVLTPAELARLHPTYRRRIVMGPSYRADMWAALAADPDLSPAELARRAYGSFATAWDVKRDFELAGPGAAAFA